MNGWTDVENTHFNVECGENASALLISGWQWKLSRGFMATLIASKMVSVLVAGCLFGRGATRHGQRGLAVRPRSALRAVSDRGHADIIKTIGGQCGRYWSNLKPKIWCSFDHPPLPPKKGKISNGRDDSKCRHWKSRSWGFGVYASKKTKYYILHFGTIKHARRSNLRLTQTERISVTDLDKALSASTALMILMHWCAVQAQHREQSQTVSWQLIWHQRCSIESTNFPLQRKGKRTAFPRTRAILNEFPSSDLRKTPVGISLTI